MTCLLPSLRVVRPMRDALALPVTVGVLEAITGGHTAAQGPLQVLNFSCPEVDFSSGLNT